MLRVRFLSLALTTLSIAFAACDRATTAPAAAAAGTYAMTAVLGRGPVSGTVTLTASGEAERRVRYQLPTGTLSSEYVARGIFQLQPDGTIDLQLRENDGQSAAIWRPFAQWHDGVLVLRHPDPADGPDIVETYERR